MTYFREPGPPRAKFCPVPDWEVGQSSPPYVFPTETDGLYYNYGERSHLHQPFDRSSVAPCKLPSLPIHLQQQLLHYKINDLHGGGAGLCNRGGAAHAQYRPELRRGSQDVHKNTETTVMG